MAENASRRSAEAKGTEGERARQAALMLLGSRDRTERELLNLLSRRFPKEAASVVAQLKSIGLLDDARVVKQCIATWNRKKPIGDVGIGAELERRGFDDRMSSQLKEGLVPEIERARIAVAKMRPPHTRARTSRHLVLHGFTQECIEAMMEEDSNSE